MSIKDLQDGLFPTKEIYLITCNKSGKLPLNAEKTEHYRRKAEYENLHLTDGMTFTQTNGSPILQPYNGNVDFMTVPYDKRNTASGNGQFVHFFVDDYKWGCSLWHNLERGVYGLRKFEGIFTPDYSLYADMPKAFNISQLYKTRFIGAYAQNIGYNVIPTASCGDADSLEYCFEGLPEHSVIGMCGTGLESHSHREHWEYAVRALEEMKEPTMLIVYGPPIKVCGLHVDIKFIDDNVSKFHRK